MLVTLAEAKTYLRVEYSDDDTLIESFISTGEKLVMDTLRIPENDENTASETRKIAVLFTVAYLYEHREDADMDELTRNLRYILMTEREVMF